MKNLMDCETNKVYKFVSFSGQDTHERHLRNLGLLPGTELVLIANEKNQPFIVLFKGTKIGLDNDIAQYIQVSDSLNSQAEDVKQLNDIEVGKHVQVIYFTETGPLKRRLMDMGLTKGTLIQVRKYAPLGDPIEITVRGYELSLRKQEASIVLVKEV